MIEYVNSKIQNCGDLQFTIFTLDDPQIFCVNMTFFWQKARFAHCSNNQCVHTRKAWWIYISVYQNPSLPWAIQISLRYVCLFSQVRVFANFINIFVRKLASHILNLQSGIMKINRSWLGSMVCGSNRCTSGIHSQLQNTDKTDNIPSKIPLKEN